MTLLEDQMADDLVRCIVTVALSAHTVPPAKGDISWHDQDTYSAERHKICVERCLKAMTKYNLEGFKCSTFEVGPFFKQP